MADTVGIILGLLGPASEFITDDFVNQVADETAYQGLDIEAVLEIVAPIIREGGNASRMELARLICVGLIRGNMIKKILRSCTPEGKALLQEAVSTFGIVESINEPGIDRRKAITLSRLRVALPMYASNLLAHERVTRPVSVAEIKSHYGIDEFPLELRDMSIASLVPKTENADMCTAILIHIYSYSVLESAKLSPKSKKLSLAERSASISKLILVSHRSIHVSTENRTLWLKNFMLKYKSKVNKIKSNGRLIRNFLVGAKWTIPNFEVEDTPVNREQNDE